MMKGTHIAMVKSEYLWIDNIEQLPIEITDTDKIGVISCKK